DWGLIFNKKYFLFLLKIKKGEGKIKAGIYRLNSKTGSLETIDKILRGKSEMTKFTIPEGFTSFDIANLIEKKNLGKKEKFLEIVRERNLEGYLFPETYFLSPGITEEKIIEVMVGQLDKVFTDKFYERAKKYKFTQKDILTLASLIEKEARKDE
ncbi:unnamed protein product, partial [marine sediment metagenome]